VAEVVLHRARIATIVSEFVVARVPEHVRVYRKRHRGRFSGAREEFAKSRRRQLFHPENNICSADVAPWLLAELVRPHYSCAQYLPNAVDLRHHRHSSLEADTIDDLDRRPLDRLGQR
jgi:hypothetical protein